MTDKIKTIEEIYQNNKKTKGTKIKLIWSSWSINKKLFIFNPFILIISIIILICPINQIIKLIFLFIYITFSILQVLVYFKKRKDKKRD
jgi:hypothetical protein